MAANCLSSRLRKIWSQEDRFGKRVKSGDRQGQEKRRARARVTPRIFSPSPVAEATVVTSTEVEATACIQISATIPCPLNMEALRLLFSSLVSPNVDPSKFSGRKYEDRIRFFEGCETFLEKASIKESQRVRVAERALKKNVESVCVYQHNAQKFDFYITLLLWNKTWKIPHMFLNCMHLKSIDKRFSLLYFNR